MRNTSRLAVIAAAVAAAFGGDAGAATPIYGAGASSVKNSILYIILKDYCSTASSVLYYDNATSAPTSSTTTPSGSTFRLQCTPVSASKFASGLDITYDSQGGQVKALAATTPALYTALQSSSFAYPVSTVTPNTGTTYGTVTPTILGSTFTFTYVWGATATALATSTAVTFGLTDTESSVFNATPFNLPLVNGSWNTGAESLVTSIAPGPELSGFPVLDFGVVYGIAASPALYKALQADQIATGSLPSTCTAGTVSSPAATCAPSIFSPQYRSLISANFGALNTNAAPLFQSVTPSNTSIEIARRDQSTGVQVESNAYFLNIGCASGATENSDLAPALPVDAGVPASPNTQGWSISYNATNTSLLKRLVTPVAYTAASSPGPQSGFVIGLISGEYESSLTGGSGFLKLDGVYPSNTNANAGYYGLVTDGYLHANPGATGDALTFVQDLAGKGTAPANETLQAYSGSGIVTLSTSSYNNNSTICAGWRHL
jgi:hypothetical protein